jgi:hypothetical protein
MADSIVKRIIRIVFDRQSADQANAQLNDSLGQAGKSGGASFLKELKASFDKAIADLKVQLARGLIDPAQFKQQADLAAQQFNTGLVAGLDKARAAGTLTNAEYLKLSKTIKVVGDSGKGLGDQFTAGLAKVGAWFASLLAFQKIAGFLDSIVKSGLDAQTSLTGLTDALGRVGLSYARVKPQVDAALASVHGFSSIDARTALTNLITITGDYNKSLGLFTLTADVATKRHTSMAEAADVVGKASLGLARGLGDLGIKTGETGDIIAKLRVNIGGLNEKESKVLAGRIQDINALWGEFKERVGLAILGSNNLSGSVGGLQKALVDLNASVEKNSGAISSLIDKLVVGATALAKFGLFIVNHTPNIYTLSKAIDWLTRKTKANADATVAANDQITASNATRRTLTATEQAALVKLMGDGSGERVALTGAETAAIDRTYRDAAAGHLTLTKEQDAAIAAFRKERTKAAQQAAKDAEKTFTEIQALAEADRVKQLDKNSQEAIATREKYDKLILQLETDAGKGRNAALAAEIAEAKRLRDKAVADVVAGQIQPSTATTPSFSPVTLPAGSTAPDNTAETQILLANLAARNAATEQGTEAIKEYNRQQEIEKLDTEALNEARKRGITITQDLIDKIHKLSVAQVDGAKKAKELTAGQSAMLSVIDQQLEGLASAWTQGGFAGIIAYAKQEARLLFAQALAYEAESLAAFAFGQVDSGAKFQAAAIAAGAGAVAMAAIGGGVSGPSGGGGTGSSSPAAGTGTSAQAPSQEVTIVLSGPGFNALNPAVQSVVYGAQQMARERYGDNAHIRVVGRSAG